MGVLSGLFARLTGKSTPAVNEGAYTFANTSNGPLRVSTRVLGRPQTNFDTLGDRTDKVLEAMKLARRAPRPSEWSLTGPLSMHLSPTERMMEWLKLQKPEVVDAVASQLNWDQSEEVILWLLNQPTTDAATAVKLFMMSQPSYYAIDDADPVDGVAKEVIDTFAANWLAGGYARGTVGYDPAEIKLRIGGVDFSDIADINELADIEVKKRASGRLPWPPLHGLAGPFMGPKPKEIEEYFADDQHELFTVRFLLGGLGTWLHEPSWDKDYGLWLSQHGLNHNEDNF
jgi:hypothetical protein